MGSCAVVFEWVGVHLVAEWRESLSSPVSKVYSSQEVCNQLFMSYFFQVLGPREWNHGLVTFGGSSLYPSSRASVSTDVVGLQVHDTSLLQTDPALRLWA